jgi:hypothetical protein
MPLRTKVPKTTGQGITRGAYKTAHKLGSSAPSSDAGLKAKKPRKGKAGLQTKQPKRNKSAPVSEPIDELTKTARDYAK